MTTKISIDKVLQQVQSWVVQTYSKVDWNYILKVIIYVHIALYTMLMSCLILRLFWLI